LKEVIYMSNSGPVKNIENTGIMARARAFVGSRTTQLTAGGVAATALTAGAGLVVTPATSLAHVAATFGVAAVEVATAGSLMYAAARGLNAVRNIDLTAAGQAVQSRFSSLAGRFRRQAPAATASASAAPASKKRSAEEMSAPVVDAAPAPAVVVDAAPAVVVDAAPAVVVAPAPAVVVAPAPAVVVDAAPAAAAVETTPAAVEVATTPMETDVAAAALAPAAPVVVISTPEVDADAESASRAKAQRTEEAPDADAGTAPRPQ
jgi:ribonuclease E